MSKNEIIQDLFTGRNFNDCVNRMEPAHLRQDLRQEVILKICELPEEKIMGLSIRGELEFYTVRIIINEMRNRHNGFSKKYLTKHEELNGHEVADQFDLESRRFKEELEEVAISEIDNLYWYDAELVRLYLEVGTFRGIQSLTGIPYASCFKSIKKSLGVIKRRAIGNSGKPKPLFTKEELAEINESPTIKMKL